MTPTQLNTARRWQQSGFTYKYIAERLGMERKAVMDALHGREPVESREDNRKRRERMKEAVHLLRRQGYSEEVIAANFGEVAK